MTRLSNEVYNGKQLSWGSPPHEWAQARCIAFGTHEHGCLDPEIAALTLYGLGWRVAPQAQPHAHDPHFARVIALPRLSLGLYIPDEVYGLLRSMCEELLDE